MQGRGKPPEKMASSSLNCRIHWDRATLLEIPSVQCREINARISLLFLAPCGLSQFLHCPVLLMQLGISLSSPGERSSIAVMAGWGQLCKEWSSLCVGGSHSIGQQYTPEVYVCGHFFTSLSAKEAGLSRTGSITRLAGPDREKEPPRPFPGQVHMRSSVRRGTWKMLLLM